MRMHIRIAGVKDSIKQLLIICIYRVLLSIVYINGVSVTYKYTGFVVKPTVFSEIVSWCFFLFLLSILINVITDEKTVFSKTVVYTLFLLIYTPFSVAVANGMYDISFIIGNNIYWIVMIVFLKLQSKKKLKSVPLITTGYNRIGERFLNVFGFISLGLVLFISWRYTGFRINLSILNVYDLRSEAANFNLPTILRYMFSWTRILNSLCLCVSLVRRKRFLAGIYFVNQVFSFGIDGMKSSMFILILDIIIFVVYRLNLYKNSYKFLGLGFNLAAIGSLLEMILLNSRWVVYLVFYRMEFLPVQISSQFFHFFTHNEPDYYRTSFLRLFGVKSPYERINYMISGVYNGDYTSEANNGLISDAITNMGVIGIVVMPIILVMFLRLFDRFSQGINRYLVLTLGIYCAITLSNMFFLPSLLTGGWIIALMLVLFIDRDQTATVLNNNTNM